jgi:hypothetical protein
VRCTMSQSRLPFGRGRFIIVIRKTSELLISVGSASYSEKKQLRCSYTGSTQLCSNVLVRLFMSRYIPEYEILQNVSI